MRAVLLLLLVLGTTVHADPLGDAIAAGKAYLVESRSAKRAGPAYDPFRDDLVWGLDLRRTDGAWGGVIGQQRLSPCCVEHVPLAPPVREGAAWIFPDACDGEPLRLTPTRDGSYETRCEGRRRLRLLPGDHHARWSERTARRLVGKTPEPVTDCRTYTADCDPRRLIGVCRLPSGAFLRVDGAGRQVVPRLDPARCADHGIPGIGGQAPPANP